MGRWVLRIQARAGRIGDEDRVGDDVFKKSMHTDTSYTLTRGLARTRFSIQQNS